MRPPEVYVAINAITTQLAAAGLPKQNFNLQDDYFYRSIDDVINRLAPLLAAHRLCVLPRALDREATARQATGNKVTTHVTMKMAFDFVSVDDGSCHTVEAFAEAMDEADKATAKAMSAAYKSAMLQAFCIPIVGADDPDSSVRPSPRISEAQPVQGWGQWSQDIIEIIEGCQSEEAMVRVQTSHRGLLKSLQRERPEVFQAVGDAFTKRRSCLSREVNPPLATVGPPEARPRSRNRSKAEKLEHA